MSFVTKIITKKDGRTFEALLDAEDEALFDSMGWYIKENVKGDTRREHFYLVHRPGKRQRTKGKPTLRFHRVVMNAPDGLFVDHINGNGLDNRKSNLRLCTNAENIRNSRVQIQAKSSQYKGVSWTEAKKKWAAEIVYTQDGVKKKLRLGRHKNEWDAAQAYNEAAVVLFGNFANLNVEAA